MSTEILLFELKLLWLLYTRRQMTAGDNTEVQQWLLYCDGLVTSSHDLQ